MKKTIYSRKWISYTSITAGLCFFASTGAVNAATDPGVRPGQADAGGPIPGLSTDPAVGELASFQIGQETFEAIDSINGDIPGEDDEGLGPTFNLNSCAGCHAFPAVGGTSPRINPQLTVANLDHRPGAPIANTIPSFLSANGPIREARFKRNADGTPDGGVHSLFVITGRTDAPPGFNLAQTNFAPHIASGNVVFRIPTPLFGAGLIEAISDRTILTNLATGRPFGIRGHANFNGNDGTTARFGWKAQNKSLSIFAGEAYNVEQGVSNPLFPNARELGNQSLIDGQPESHVDLATGAIGDVELFANFMTMLDAPARRNPPNVSNASVAAGNAAFNSVGCVQCHTTSLRTSTSNIAALSNRTAALFSDLGLHHMGWRLADEVSQGAAEGDEFRTAPLWGLGQRIFLLHDGRFTDLEQTIREHASEARAPFPASEANTVVQRFINLPDSQKQDLFNFLRSL